MLAYLSEGRVCRLVPCWVVNSKERHFEKQPSLWWPSHFCLLCPSRPQCCLNENGFISQLNSHQHADRCSTYPKAIGPTDLSLKEEFCFTSWRSEELNHLDGSVADLHLYSFHPSVVETQSQQLQEAPLAPRQTGHLHLGWRGHRYQMLNWSLLIFGVCMGGSHICAVLCVCACVCGSQGTTRDVVSPDADHHFLLLLGPYLIGLEFAN